MEWEVVLGEQNRSVSLACICIACLEWWSGDVLAMTSFSLFSSRARLLPCWVSYQIQIIRGGLFR